MNINLTQEELEERMKEAIADSADMLKDLDDKTLEMLWTVTGAQIQALGMEKAKRMGLKNPSIIVAAVDLDEPLHETPETEQN